MSFLSKQWWLLCESVIVRVKTINVKRTLKDGIFFWNNSMLLFQASGFRWFKPQEESDFYKWWSLPLPCKWPNKKRSDLHRSCAAWLKPRGLIAYSDVRPDSITQWVKEVGKKICDLTGKKRSASYLLQYISIGIQCGNTASLHWQKSRGDLQSLTEMTINHNSKCLLFRAIIIFRPISNLITKLI